MEIPMSSNTLALIDALCAKGPADDRAESMMLYGQFVGSWDGTVIVYRSNGERFESTCEVHFGWTLAGRAVQDVWIIPSRRSRPAGESDRMYGTTLRIYVPQDDEWQIIWSDPVRQAYDRMTGRKAGADILQEYCDSAGAICQWCFTAIQDDSFHWISRESVDDRSTWKLTSEFFLKRRRRDDDARIDDSARNASLCGTSTSGSARGASPTRRRARSSAQAELTPLWAAGPYTKTGWPGVYRRL
jgi:hypothetical protein